ncbi:MAG: hypothetical protein KAF91_32510 [Nostoc sp. TH1S01]|nr:hypothetical protein [Nostoc sp. TH1S01]
MKTLTRNISNLNIKHDTSDNPSFNYKNLLQRLKVGNIDYFIGRFLFFRRFYSLYKYLKQKLLKVKKEETFISQICDHSKLDVNSIVSQIKQDSYYNQLYLQESTVLSILKSAKSRYLIAKSEPTLIFFYDDYAEKIKPFKKLAMAHVSQPLKIEEIYKLRHDKFILSVVEKYLGYYPEKCTAKLWWSFADNLSSQDRRKQFQTIDYHYDVHGFNFCYVSFYITDVDIKSGAHVLVKSSHKNKKLFMLYRSARLPDLIIEQNYSTDDIVVIEGAAGKGFFEDTSCYHKALPPIERDRLLLQLRYF